MRNLVQAYYETLLASEGMPDELPSVFNSDVLQFPEEGSTELEKAGVDTGTDSATFMEMNGRNIFVQGETSNE